MAVLRTMVYEGDGMTLITELPHRKGVNCHEPLNTTGTGGLTLKLPSEILDDNPGLFAWGNIVKFWLGSKVIHGFRVQTKRTVYVDGEEWSGFVREYSGPSVQIYLEDFMVVHDGKVRPDSLDTRSYSWASMRAEWYNPAQWNAPIATRAWSDPPGRTVVFWTRDPDAPDPEGPNPKPGPGVPGSIRHETKAKKNQPKGWPDKSARWVFVPDTYTGKRGGKYYRKNFSLKQTQHVRIFGAADERLRIYMDGEEVLSADNVETGYTEKNSVDLILGPGLHTIAVFASGLYSAKGDGNDSMLMTMMYVNRRGRAKGVILHSDASWEAHYGSPPPGWNRAQVLRNCVLEAKRRNNSSANLLTLDFTETHDSEGKRWHDRWNDDVSIGTSALGLVGSLSEGGHFDVWVNPANMKIQAFRRRGKNKSHSITLEPGRNLLSWEVEQVDNVKNDFLIQYEGGWTHYRDRKSKKVYNDREAFVSLGNSKEAPEAINLMRRACRGIASAEQRAGTSDMRVKKENTPSGGIISVKGARPFLDFGVGDTIKAPNAHGILVPHRVLSLSLTEDDDGKLTFDGEYEEVR